MKTFRYFRHGSTGRYVFPKLLEINAGVTFNVAVITGLCISAAYRISSSGSSLHQSEKQKKSNRIPLVLRLHGTKMKQIRIRSRSTQSIFMAANDQQIDKFYVYMHGVNPIWM
jgi:hypothetical protein